MIRTLLWKEYREQRTIALALLVFAMGLPTLVQLFVEPADAHDTPFSNMAIAIIWLAGLVVGGQAFAGEREGGTQPWLDALPAWRRMIGRTKIAFSLIVLASIAAALFVLGRSTNWARPVHGVEFLGLLTVLGLNGLGCGLLGSTLGRTSLTAIGWGIAAQGVMSLIWLVIGLAAGPTNSEQDTRALTIGGLLSMPLPFAIALYRFQVPDRARRCRSTKSAASRTSWRSMLWLAWRQNRVTVGIIVATGLATAIYVYVSRNLLVWPAFGLAFGIVAGLESFGPDRAGDSQRLFGDRRWPIGRVWWTKFALGFSFALIPVLLQLAFLAFRKFADWQDLAPSHMKADLAQHVWPFVRMDYLLLGPLYGFAVGQFLGMISRKSAVAFVLSALIGSFFVAAWWPSLYFGGLHLWQWAIPPVLLIAATRCLAWTWATGRLSEPKSILEAVGIFALATGAMIGGIAYRTIEVPDRAPPFDVAAFEASLPTPEQNQAILKLTQLLRQFRAEVQDPTFKIRRTGESDPQWNWLIRAQKCVVAQSWPTEDGELSRKLDEFAKLPFIGNLRTAVALPFGMAEFSGGKIGATDYQQLGAATYLASAVAARSLQLATRGEAAAAFDLLFVVLEFGRHLQSRAENEVFVSGIVIEQTALRLFPIVARSSGGDNRLLRDVTAQMDKMDQSSPPVADTIKISYLIALQTIRNGGVAPNSASSETWTPRRLAAMAPWEITRSVHVINATIAGFLRTEALSYPEAIDRIGDGPKSLYIMEHWLSAWTPVKPRSIAEFQDLRDWVLSSFGQQAGFPTSQVLIQSQVTRTLRRAVILQIALVAYRAENHEPAAKLGDLVPSYLSGLPQDPYSEQPFSYRVSAGEQIAMYPAKSPDAGIGTTLVPAGVGILWSVGGDIRDDGGFVNHASPWGAIQFHPGRDLIFLVPEVRQNKGP